MNNINPNRKIYFKAADNGVNKMNTDKTYEDYFYEALENVIIRAKREVPEHGDFSPVYEDFPNMDNNIPIDKYRLEIMKMPRKDVPDEKERFIKASVFKRNSDYAMNILLAGGHKDNIISYLESDEFPDKLNNAYIKLVDNIKKQ